MVLQTTALPLGYAAFLVGAILNADRFFDKGKCVRCSGLLQARKKGVSPASGRVIRCHFLAAGVWCFLGKRGDALTDYPLPVPYRDYQFSSPNIAARPDSA